MSSTAVQRTTEKTGERLRDNVVPGWRLPVEELFVSRKLPCIRTHGSARLSQWFSSRYAGPSTSGRRSIFVRHSVLCCSSVVLEFIRNSRVVLQVQATCRVL